MGISSVTTKNRLFTCPVLCKQNFHHIRPQRWNLQKSRVHPLKNRSKFDQNRKYTWWPLNKCSSSAPCTLTQSNKPWFSGAISCLGSENLVFSSQVKGVFFYILKRLGFCYWNTATTLLFGHAMSSAFYPQFYFRKFKTNPFFKRKWRL